MKTEREKITGKVAAAALRLAGEPYTLEPGEENCYLLLVYEGSVPLEYGGETMLVNPGSAGLLGAVARDHGLNDEAAAESAEQ